MPRNITLTATLPAAPETLYDMYLDAAAHSAFTGHAVSIEARAGAAFSAFGGMLSGKIIHLEPRRLIVQTWRSINFAKDDIDSVLVLSFWSDPKGARVDLQQVNAPEADFENLISGWEKFYWTPWREYLEAQAKK
jgi:activator of HSP90 ATPase